jgi:hypothetical protein
MIGTLVLWLAATASQEQLDVAAAKLLGAAPDAVDTIAKVH